MFVDGWEASKSGGELFTLEKPQVDDSVAAAAAAEGTAAATDWDDFLLYISNTQLEKTLLENCTVYTICKKLIILNMKCSKASSVMIKINQCQLITS